MTHLPALAAIIDLDVTVFFQLALFLFLVVVLNILVFKPLLALFKQRREATEGQENETREKQLLAADLAARHETEMAGATAQGMAAHNRVKEQAMAEESALLSKVRAKSAARLESELATYAQEIEEARTKAGPAISEMGSNIAQLLSGTAAGTPGTEEEA